MGSRLLWTLALSLLTAVLCKGVTLEMPPSGLFPGDSAVVRCVGLDMKNVNLFKDGREVKGDRSHQIIRTDTKVELIISPVSENDLGAYSCVSNGNYQHNQKTMWRKWWRRRISLTTSSYYIPDQGSVTLTCSVEGYPNPQWLRRSSDSDTHLEKLKENTDAIRVSRGGVYSCRGSDEFIVTEESDKVPIWETGGLPLKMPSEAYSGETVIVRCEGPVQTHLYFYKDGVIVKNDTNHWFKRTSETTVELRIHVSASDQGSYSCGINGGTLYTGHQFLRIYTGWIRSVKLTTENHFIPNQGTVRLKCEIQGVYKYEWIRRSSAQNSTLEILKEDTPTVTVSRGGVYSCSGKVRLYRLTAESERVTIWETVLNRAVVQPDPAWTEVFSGESLSLRCDVKDEGGSEWSYVWWKSGVILPTATREYTLSSVSVSDSGGYSCRATRETFQSTMWSQESRIQVLSKAVPVLSVSPLWLSPGASVSLKCDVTAPSAGWRFHWYRAVPLPSGSYSYELLPGLTSGTAHGSFTVHSLSSTAGFVCRASRGSPEVYTEYSPPQFVWSADAPGSRVSPIVHPNSSQHLTFDPVSVSCGSSDEDWRVQMFSLTTHSLNQCPSHTGEKQECSFSTDEETRVVFWCESGRGEMTDAVNISIHNSVILLIPAQPVPEGRSVSLTCKVRQSDDFSSVRFYKDEQFIQEETSRIYNISSVSKSDEGLYRCGIHRSSNQVLTSPESWLSVSSSEARSSSVLVLVLVGFGFTVFLIVLLILLLVLWRYRKNKDQCVMRSQETNQTPAGDHVTTASPNQEVTYSQIEFRERRERGREADVMFSSVIAQSAADVDVMYAQISHYRKGKERSEVKPSDTCVEETVYSEVKRPVRLTGAPDSVGL